MNVSVWSVANTPNPNTVRLFWREKKEEEIILEHWSEVRRAACVFLLWALCRVSLSSWLLWSKCCLLFAHCIQCVSFAHSPHSCRVVVGLAYIYISSNSKTKRKISHRCDSTERRVRSREKRQQSIIYNCMKSKRTYLLASVVWISTEHQRRVRMAANVIVRYLCLGSIVAKCHAIFALQF